MRKRSNGCTEWVAAKAHATFARITRRTPVGPLVTGPCSRHNAAERT
jgi:hypothetical protein